MAAKSMQAVAVEHLIYVIRGQGVMLDSDLAQLYGVQTRTLIQSVKRNSDRFPEDFMFQLNYQDVKLLRSQNVISSWGGRRHLPYVFTEQGVAMLSSVLRSEVAIAVNVQIIRTFVKLRKLLFTHDDLRLKIEDLEKKYNDNFVLIFDALRGLMQLPEKKNRPIGFVINE